MRLQLSALANLRRGLQAAIAGLGLVGIATSVHAQAEQQFADLGTCELRSGEVIRDCRIGYLTFGRLNADRSNAILFPTALWNKAAAIAELLGPQGLLDPADWYVIAVDAFGNGVSSSPSNSPTQSAEAFPQFSIRDMVNSQYRLITEVLNIQKLYAVVGISMGGIQTFEWMVAYPSMMRKAVPMVGTPRPASYDLLLWGTVVDAIEQCQSAGCKNTGALALKIANLGLVSPRERMATIPRDRVNDFVIGLEDEARSTFKADDAVSQVRAILGHDVSSAFAGSMEDAAAAVQADTLIVVGTEDRNVSPQPALEFASLIGAQVHQSDGPCGHLIPVCEMESIGRVIASFLSR